MKKNLASVIALILAAAMLSLLAVSCKKPDDPGGVDEIDLTPTENPNAGSTYDGDWYGVCTIVDAGGKYIPNRGIVNDCVMRIACGETGEGSFYLVVNSIGALFDGGTAKAEGNTVKLTGTVANVPVEWVFRYDDGALACMGEYGSGDFMRFDILLRHCSDEWSGDRIPKGYDYVRSNGFAGVLEKMGGELSKLPRLSGEGLDLQLAERASNVPDEDTFNAEGRVVSEDGELSIVLPEGYEVAPRNSHTLVITNIEKNTMIMFDLFASDDDPLNEMTFEAGKEFFGETYYSSIDGFDCFSTVVRNTEGGSRIILFGKGEGRRMLKIICSMQDDVLNTLRMMNNEESDFGVAAFNLLVKRSGEGGRQ